MKRVWDLVLVVASLVFIFWPWMMILAGTLCWFFGVPQFFEWNHGRALFAALWPFGAVLVWLFLMSLYEAFE